MLLNILLNIEAKPLKKIKIEKEKNEKINSCLFLTNKIKKTKKIFPIITVIKIGSTL
tara:strand:- start:176 stop:346 length:171 start_codon:yes stop_codon:yes gene_type:complete